MTACQICSKVKTHCSCMGCETLNSSCTLWKPHLMQRTQPALPSTTLDTGHRLRTGKLHQPRQQSAPFLKGRKDVHPATSKCRWCSGSMGYLENTAAPTVRLIYPVWHVLSVGKKSIQDRLDFSCGRTRMTGGLWLSPPEEKLYQENTPLG